jgi:hypothetical protein
MRQSITASLAIALALAACAPPAPNQTKVKKTTDPTPVDAGVTQTKNPQTDGGTNGQVKPGCDGITEKGTCVVMGTQQLVRVCDTKLNMLKPDINCTATGQICGYDASGAVACVAAGSGKGNTGTTTGGACGSLTYAGTCVGNTVHYCYNNRVTDVPCNAGYSCTTSGSCGGSGAECCPTSGGGGGGGGGSCGSLTYDGLCTDSQTVRYCLNGTATNLTCNPGNHCGVNECGSGAQCCGSGSSGGTGSGSLPADGTPCTSVSPALTFDGLCAPDGHTVVYCDNGTTRWLSCNAGNSCQVNACDTGAQCCAGSSGGSGGSGGSFPPSAGQPCGALTYDGVCSADISTVIYCDGGVTTYLQCYSYNSCQVGACGSGAQCCPMGGGGDSCATISCPSGCVDGVTGPVCL